MITTDDKRTSNDLCDKNTNHPFRVAIYWNEKKKEIES